jgi:hypothetical protein
MCGDHAEVSWVQTFKVLEMAGEIGFSPLRLGRCPGKYQSSKVVAEQGIYAVPELSVYI